MPINKVTITQPATGSTLTIADGKTLTVTQNTSLDEAVAMSSKRAILSTTLPAFLAYLSTPAANISGGSVEATVIFDTEVFDQNAAYNHTTGVFTAPVTGKYQLTGHLWLTDLAANHTEIYLEIVTSARVYYTRDFLCLAVPRGVEINVLADMAATNTAAIKVYIVGGSQVVDVYGAANGSSYFCGHLVC